MDWETLIENQGLRWALPEEVGKAAASQSKGEGSVSGSDTGEVGLSQQELDRLFLEQIERKREAGGVITKEEWERYMEIGGFGD